MLVKSIMIPKFHCHSVEKDDSIGKVLDILNDYNLDALPVLDGELYVGTITRFRIYERYFLFLHDRRKFLTETKCSELASKAVKTVDESELFEKTIFEFKDFPQLAIVDKGNKFLGIVTRHDVLEQFEGAFGLRVPGVRLAITSVETKGRLARLAEITNDFHEHVISIVSFDETDKLVRRLVLKVEKSENIHRYMEKLESAGFRILDMREE